MKQTISANITRPKKKKKLSNFKNMFENYICTFPSTLEFPLSSIRTSRPHGCQVLIPWGYRWWHQHYPTIFNGSHLIPESSLTPHTDKRGLCLGPTNLPLTYPLLSGQYLLPPAQKPQGLRTCVPSTQNVPCPFCAHSLPHPFRIPIKLNYLPRSSMTTPFILQTSAQLFPFLALFSCTDCISLWHSPCLTYYL